MNFKVHIVLFISQLNPAIGKTLESINAQSYQNLELSLVGLFLETPQEYKGHTIHPSPKKKNFSAGLNMVLEKSTADFMLVVSQDVVLKPDTIEQMVDSAESGQASVVGAKLVLVSAPSQLAEAGLKIDKTGVVAPRAAYQELDQGQYDIVEPIFAVGKDCVLIKRETLLQLGGFDEAMANAYGEVDFCWRVNLVGQKVQLAPKALGLIQTERQSRRSQFFTPNYYYQLRMILGNYSVGTLFCLFPQVVCIALLGAIGSIFAPKKLGAIFYAWLKIAATFFGILKKRKWVAKNRNHPDRHIRNLQEKGFSRLTNFLEEGGFSGSSLRKLFHGRGVWVVWIAILAAFMFGSRHLITQFFPQVGELLSFQSHFFKDWLDSYQSSGLGADGYHSNAGFWLGILHIIFFGAEDLARTVFLLSPFILGAWGAWYLLNQIAKRPAAKTVATISYLLMPLPYIALANGDLNTLIFYAATPWIIALLLKHIVQKTSLVTQSLILGMLIGVTAGFSPQIFGLLLVLVAGCVMAGIITAILNFRALVVGIVGAIVGILLNFTYLFPSRGIQFFEWRPKSVGQYKIHEILSFDLGSFPGSYLVWGFVGAALILLFFAKGERSVWITHGCVLYLGGAVLAWTGQQGWHSFASPQLLLIPAAAGLAMALGMGVDILSADIKKKLWSRFCLLIATLAVIIAAAPVLILSLDGRWKLPVSDYALTYSIIDETSQRIVWIGHPDVLGVGSWRLDEDVSFSVTQKATNDISGRLIRPSDKNIDLIKNEIIQLEKQDRIGGKLALFGVSHIVLVEKFHPEAKQEFPVALTVKLDSQLDLKLLNTRQGIRVYENKQVIPVRASLPAGMLSNSILPPASATEAFRQSSTQELPAGDFYLADASPNWILEVAGANIESEQVFGWAKQYSHLGGDAQLTYRSEFIHQIVLAIQIMLWPLILFLTLLWVAKIRKLEA